MSQAWIASYIILWGVIAFMGFIMMGLLRQVGLLQMRVGGEAGVLITKEGLERGAQGPDFAGRDLITGGSFSLSSFRGRRVVIVFLSPSCESCRTLIAHLNDVAQQWREIQFLAICHGAEDACRELGVQTHLRVPLLADGANEIARRYLVPSTPFAFLINEQGLVLIRGVVNTWPQLTALLDERGTLRSGVGLDEIIVQAGTTAVEGSVGGHGGDMPVAGSMSAQSSMRQIAGEGAGHG